MDKRQLFGFVLFWKYDVSLFLKVKSPASEGVGEGEDKVRNASGYVRAATILQKKCA